MKKKGTECIAKLGGLGAWTPLQELQRLGCRGTTVLSIIITRIFMYNQCLGKTIIHGACIVANVTFAMAQTIISQSANTIILKSRVASMAQLRELQVKYWENIE